MVKFPGRGTPKPGFKSFKNQNMQRTIKFRGQSEEDKKWTFGDLITNKGLPYIVNGVVEANEEWISLEEWQPVIFETVGQFTGLKDKNGVDIYEGDVLKDDRGRLITIEWHNVVSSFCLVYNKSFRHYFAESYNPDQLEVIGSIHSNPELIK